MADDADRAQKLEEKQRQIALERAHNNKIYGKSSGDCVECGDPIDPNRVAAINGVMTCIDCQEENERG